MNLFYLLSYGLNSTTNVLFQVRLWYEITHEGLDKETKKNQPWLLKSYSNTQDDCYQ